jgi:ferritin-like metal-binding protein YciE
MTTKLHRSSEETPSQKGPAEPGFFGGLEPRCGFVIIRRTFNRSFSMSKTKTLQDLFHDTLKDIYFAEKKIMGALPKMAKAAQNDQLRAAFEKHLEETEGQVERLEAVFDEINARPQGKTCDAIMGILEEGKEIMSEYKGAPALDAGLLAAAQAVEHYEISRYGTLITWADELGLTNAAKLLKQTLAEEKKTDETLTGIAKTVVNMEAEAA